MLFIGTLFILPFSNTLPFIRKAQKTVQIALVLQINCEWGSCPYTLTVSDEGRTRNVRVTDRSFCGKKRWCGRRLVWLHTLIALDLLVWLLAVQLVLSILWFYSGINWSVLFWLAYTNCSFPSSLSDLAFPVSTAFSLWPSNLWLGQYDNGAIEVKPLSNAIKNLRSTVIVTNRTLSGSYSASTVVAYAMWSRPRFIPSWTVLINALQSVSVSWIIVKQSLSKHMGLSIMGPSIEDVRNKVPVFLCAQTSGA